MPDNDLTAIMAVADRTAIHGPLTDTQRDAALQAIEHLRLSMPVFLDEVSKLLNGNAEDAMSAHSLAMQGHRLARDLHEVCKAVWQIENDLISQYKLGSPALGKEETS